VTKFPELWNALSADFDPRLVRTRPAGKAGTVMVPYITARTAMNRLDAVLGFESWWDSYERDPGGSDNIVCRLTIRLPDGSTLTKSDAGSPGSTGDDGEDDKGAFSDALKRAAVKFGIGRSLYADGCYRCPRAGEPEEPIASAPPPRESLPSQGRSEHAPEPEPMRRPGTGRGKAPTTGGALYRWAKDQDERDDAGLVEHLARWAKREGLPRKMVDWDADEVSRGYAEAVKRLQSAEALAN
jgi:hypothetical protein